MVAQGGFVHNAIKAPHRYAVQGSDTTMFSKGPFARAIKKIRHPASADLFFTTATSYFFQATATNEPGQSRNVIDEARGFLILLSVIPKAA